MDSSQLVQDVIDGVESPLKGLALLKEQKAYLEKCIAEIEPIALEEASKYDSNTFEDKGFRFERRTGGAMYSYKHIPEWVQAKEALKEIEQRSKQAWSSKSNGLIPVTEDGEEIMLPVVSYRKDSISAKPVKNKMEVVK